jgi:hypothetical protein
MICFVFGSRAGCSAPATMTTEGMGVTAAMGVTARVTAVTASRTVVTARVTAARATVALVVGAPVTVAQAAVAVAATAPVEEVLQMAATAPAQMIPLAGTKTLEAVAGAVTRMMAPAPVTPLAGTKTLVAERGVALTQLEPDLPMRVPAGQHQMRRAGLKTRPPVVEVAQHQKPDWEAYQVFLAMPRPL